ncbi:MAG: alpha/beta fold hydrolase [Gammaproteobacteria bacterium]|nr:alpha/beta fold hydrolase [Gammaproteobacteria bacterium]
MKYRQHKCPIGRQPGYFILIILVVSGCAGPSARFQQTAGQYGFTRNDIPGLEFTHAVYSSPNVNRGRRLHVYLGSDGLPWIRGRWESRDPTPRVPVGLTLLSLDSNPAIYLGRPCYHGHASDSECTPHLWTNARYSERVVGSMEQALRKVMADKGYEEVVFIGYSGGGVLAMLMAERFPETRSVVTVAANLDTAAWTSHHHYDPLTGSLNPGERASLNSTIHQYHLAGALDSNVPSRIIQSAARKQPSAQYIEWASFDHSCCWETIWKPFLSCLNSNCAWSP